MKKLCNDMIKVYEVHVIHAVAHLDETFYHHAEMTRLTNL